MTTSNPFATGYVLVGVGSSPASASAARWAAAEAVRRNAALYAIHVLPAEHSRDELTEARRLVPARVGEWLADADNQPVVAVRVTTGVLASELDRYARLANVVVVGEPSTSLRNDLPRRLCKACPGVVVVVDADGRARHLTSEGAVASSLSAPTVRDVMTSPAITVEADLLLAEVVRALDRHSITSLPVVDAEGRLVGVVGEAEVVRHLGDRGSSVRVQDAMSPVVWSVAPDEALRDVAELFGRSQLKSLPVVQRGRVVGVISRRDLVRAAAREQRSTAVGSAP